MRRAGRLDRGVRRGIRSRRLALETLTIEHADEMATVLADPALYTFIGGEPPTVQQLRNRYREQIDGSGRTDELWANWVIRRREDNLAVGFVQATLVREARRWVGEVAWVVGTAFQGRGIAREAAAAVMLHLTRLGVMSFRAHISDGNDASVAVARRVGLSPTESFNEGGERLYVRCNPVASSITALRTGTAGLASHAAQRRPRGRRDP